MKSSRRSLSTTRGEVSRVNAKTADQVKDKRRHTIIRWIEEELRESLDVIDPRRPGRKLDSLELHVKWLNNSTRPKNLTSLSDWRAELTRLSDSKHVCEYCKRLKERNGNAKEEPQELGPDNKIKLEGDEPAKINFESYIPTRDATGQHLKRSICSGRRVIKPQTDGEGIRDKWVRQIEYRSIHRKSIIKENITWCYGDRKVEKIPGFGLWAVSGRGAEFQRSDKRNPDADWQSQKYFMLTSKKTTNYSTEPPGDTSERPAWANSSPVGKKTGLCHECNTPTFLDQDGSSVCPKCFTVMPEEILVGQPSNEYLEFDIRTDYGIQFKPDEISETAVEYTLLTDWELAQAHPIDEVNAGRKVERTKWGSEAKRLWRVRDWEKEYKVEPETREKRVSTVRKLKRLHKIVLECVDRLIRPEGLMLGQVLNLASNRGILRNVYQNRYGDIPRTSFEDLVKLYADMEYWFIDFNLRLVKDPRFLFWARHRYGINEVLNERSSTTEPVCSPDYLALLAEDFRQSVELLEREPHDAIYEDRMRQREIARETSLCWKERRSRRAL